MSATLDAAPVARYLGGARVIRSEGRQYPLESNIRRTPPRLSINRWPPPWNGWRGTGWPRGLPATSLCFYRRR